MLNFSKVSYHLAISCHVTQDLIYQETIHANSLDPSRILIFCRIFSDYYYILHFCTNIEKFQFFKTFYLAYVLHFYLVNISFISKIFLCFFFGKTKFKNIAILSFSISLICIYRAGCHVVGLDISTFRETSLSSSEEILKLPELLSKTTPCQLSRKLFNYKIFYSFLSQFVVSFTLLKYLFKFQINGNV